MALTDQFDQRILELVNQERAKQGLRSLSLSQKLDAAADGHSGRMANGDFFSHVDPGNGSRPSDRATQAGYRWTTVGENIAAGQTSPEAVMQAWMNSSGHRANILNPNYTHLGVGYAYLANDSGRINYQRYWTQVFGAGDPNPGTYTAQSEGSSTPSPSPNPNPPGETQGSGELKGTNGNDELTGDSSAQTIYGYRGNDTLTGQGGNDRLFAGSGNDRVYGDGGDDYLSGGSGKDMLLGGDGTDTLVGVATNQQPGRGEIDTLAGGAGADTFRLGDSNSVYYNDGRNNTLGQADYALIQDFSQAEGDVIQLKGSASNYALGAAVQGLPTGTAIYLKTTGQDELIAVVQNASNLSLESNSFNYV
ncbi:type I secretion protein [Hydrococcus rivularis NIES-593]|uniref:Type I secretion protein n=1 Tax=Hydrococcus rivularis NIES-593 TaxID=1921803 RepID=A0A1U7HNH9_9CYAN|nr:CAP domain-containing protein [Hydrococcus rivularis]OKH25127.1 type I secretion protein [Hydrococcus rivularis NIES-593]